MRMTPEKRAQMESYWGKDVPPAERYLNWAKDFVRGDMGTSLKYNRRSRRSLRRSSAIRLR